jgi:16S rRNA (guanine527-N7)-methyltransferase
VKRERPDDDGMSAALAALAERHGLQASQAKQLRVVLERLAREKTAPTSVKDASRALGVHLADSLTALELAEVRAGAALVDIGAGAGFPGIPLAVALPASRVALLESQSRKCSYMESVLTCAQIGNAQVVCTRAEEWPQGTSKHDVALARAVAAQAVVLEYAAPLLGMGGTLVDWRGRRERAEEQAGRAAAAQLGLELVTVLRTVPFAGAKDHHLHVFKKVAPTPSRFPRRAGMARKRPLA